MNCPVRRNTLNLSWVVLSLWTVFRAILLTQSGKRVSPFSYFFFRGGVKGYHERVSIQFVLCFWGLPGHQTGWQFFKILLDCLTKLFHLTYCHRRFSLSFFPASNSRHRDANESIGHGRETRPPLDSNFSGQLFLG